PPRGAQRAIASGSRARRTQVSGALDRRVAGQSADAGGSRDRSGSRRGAVHIFVSFEMRRRLMESTTEDAGLTQQVDETTLRRLVDAQWLTAGAGRGLGRHNRGIDARRG